MLEREPTFVGTVEVLHLASMLWHEFGNEKKAVAVGQLAETLWGGRERAASGETLKKESPEADTAIRQRKQFEDELAELEAVIEKARARAQELRRELNN